MNNFCCTDLVHRGNSEGFRSRPPPARGLVGELFDLFPSPEFPHVVSRVPSRNQFYHSSKYSNLRLHFLTQLRCNCHPLSSTLPHSTGYCTLSPELPFPSPFILTFPEGRNTNLEQLESLHPQHPGEKNHGTYRIQYLQLLGPLQTQYLLQGRCPWLFFLKAAEVRQQTSTREEPSALS